MINLPTIRCPKCHDALEDIEPGAKAKPAADYESCRRRCDKCGLGFSNASTADVRRLTIVYRDCFNGIPLEVAEGYERVLAQAVNEIARGSKRKRFMFSTSEDHVTWTVFRRFHIDLGLLPAIKRAGVRFLPEAGSEPAMLLWGSPFPSDNQEGRSIRERLVRASDNLAEDRDKRSEPDVILDFRERGIVFIEVKHLSENSVDKKGSCNWHRYLDGSGAFLSESETKRTGLYELARNWRLAWEMANGLPFAVVNLGPEGLFSAKFGDALNAFAKTLAQNERRQFAGITWEKFLGDLTRAPGWFRNYLDEREVVLLHPPIVSQVGEPNRHKMIT